VFWNLTLREFDTLLDRCLRVREREADLPAAVICSVLASLQRNPDIKPDPWTAAEFLPKPIDAEPEVDDGTMMLRKAAKMVAIMGGVIEPEVASILERAQGKRSNDAR
jgi:hypothetical protein